MAKRTNKRTNTDRTYLNLVYFDWDKFMKAVEEKEGKAVGVTAVMREHKWSTSLRTMYGGRVPKDRASLLGYEYAGNPDAFIITPPNPVEVKPQKVEDLMDIIQGVEILKTKASAIENAVNHVDSMTSRYKDGYDRAANYCKILSGEVTALADAVKRMETSWEEQQNSISTILEIVADSELKDWLIHLFFNAEGRSLARPKIQVLQFSEQEGYMVKDVERVAKKIGIVATMRGNSGSQRKDEYWALPANYNRRLA